MRQNGHSEFTPKMLTTIYDNLFAVPFTNSIWTARFPELAARFGTWRNGTQAPGHDSPSASTAVPRNNAYTLNVVVNATGPSHVPGDVHFHNWTANADGLFSLPSPWWTPGIRGGCTPNTTQYFDVLPNNIKSSNPGFASPNPAALLNFSLESNSTLFDMGWQQIPQRDIGPDW